MKTSSHRRGYHSWVGAIGFAAAALVVGCSSSSQATPAPSSSGAGTTTATTATTPPPSGVLPLLAKDAQRTTYTVDGVAKELLSFDKEKVTVSASCAKPDGTLDCEAMQLLRRGKTVELSSAELSRGLPPGAVVCAKLKIANTTGRDAKGNEDGFCSFPDGSLVSHGSVDHHVLAP